jgi:hypothetical protein
MNTGPGNAGNPAGVFAPGTGLSALWRSGPAIIRKQNQWAPGCGGAVLARTARPA